MLKNVQLVEKAVTIHSFNIY